MSKEEMRMEKEKKTGKKLMADIIVGGIFLLLFIGLIALSYSGVIANCGAEIWITIIGILAVAGGTVSLLMQDKKLKEKLNGNAQ